MIKDITIRNANGTFSDIFNPNPERGYGFAITSITGLGPGKANLFTREQSLLTGSVFDHSRKQERDITFNVQLLDMGPLWIEKQRELLYDIFPLGEEVEIAITTNELAVLYPPTTRDRQRKIKGIVDSNDVTIFGKAESAVINVHCPGYYFTESKTAHWELPDTVNYDNDDTEVLFWIMNEGHAKTGAKYELVFKRNKDDVSNIVIENMPSSPEHGDWNYSLKIDFSKLPPNAPLAGNKIVVNTIPGEKSILLYKNNGTETVNLINTFRHPTNDGPGDWIPLEPSRYVHSGNIFFETENGVHFTADYRGQPMFRSQLFSEINIYYDELYDGV